MHVTQDVRDRAGNPLTRPRGSSPGRCVGIGGWSPSGGASHQLLRAAAPPLRRSPRPRRRSPRRRDGCTLEGAAVATIPPTLPRSSLHRRLRWSQTVILPRGSRGSPKAATTNKRHDFAKLEREYITSQISLRELCRRHGISTHSLVTVQAKQGRWPEKCEAYRAKASDAYIQHHAVNMAAREAQVRERSSTPSMRPSPSSDRT